MSSYTIPYVIEKTPSGERSFDIYSRLLQERIVFVGTEIDDGVANVVMAQLLHLSYVAPDREVSLYVNSPGGSFTALMAIYDTMQLVPTPVATYCLGQAASAAAVLLAAGEPGRRFALKHSRVLLHQPSAGGQGTVSDLALQADELLRVRAQVEAVLSRHTGRTVDQLRADTDRDKVLTAAQAVAFGIVDHVIERAAEAEVGAKARAQVGAWPASTSGWRQAATCSAGRPTSVAGARPPPAHGAADRTLVSSSTAGSSSDPSRRSREKPLSSRWAAPTSRVTLDPSATQIASSTSDDGSLRPRSTSDR
jgi:ATP-dependent Clp protease, protease subunit